MGISAGGRSFADKVKASRQALGLTQSELSAKLAERGVTTSQTHMTRLEAGKRIPRVDEAIVLAEILGFSLDDLVGTPRAPRVLDALGDQFQAARAANRRLVELFNEAVAILVRERGRTQERAAYDALDAVERGAASGPRFEPVAVTQDGPVEQQNDLLRRASRVTEIAFTPEELEALEAEVEAEDALRPRSGWEAKGDEGDDEGDGHRRRSEVGDEGDEGDGYVLRGGGQVDNRPKGGQPDQSQQVASRHHASNG